MLGADFEAEYVTGQVEFADLATAVIQDLGGADGAADELIEVFGRLIHVRNLNQ